MTAYLVTVPGLAGPERQIWYSDDNRFVGPPLEHTKVPLPERERWSIDAAINYVHRATNAA